MKEQFATYEIALKLKELWFDEECIAWYYLPTNAINENDYILALDSETPENQIVYIKAPLWQQVIDWLRDKYGLHIEIQSPDFKHEYQFNWTIHKIQQFGGFANGSSNNFYESREQAILKAIEIIKSNNHG